jgi:hypothetical protein
LKPPDTPLYVRYRVEPDGDCGIHSLFGILDAPNRVSHSPTQDLIRSQFKKMLDKITEESMGEQIIKYFEQSVISYLYTD